MSLGGRIGRRTARERRPAARPVRAALLVSIVVGLAACTGETQPVIEVAEVRLGSVQEIVEAPANVAAKASMTLVAPAAGKIDLLEIEDGQRVAAGDVVLSIDSEQAQAQLRQAVEADSQAAAAVAVPSPAFGVSETAARADLRARKAFEKARRAAEQIPDPATRSAALAALASAEADYAAVRSDAQRALDQFNAGLGSLSDVLSSLNWAQRVQTLAAVELARRTIDALVVKAPISGVVSLAAAGQAGGAGAPDLSALPPSLSGAVAALGGTGGAVSDDPLAPIALGTPVAAGQVLVVITDVSSLSLIADVDETDVLQVERGTPAVVELDALPGSTFQAEVTSVDVAPTTSTRGGVAYRVRLSLGPGLTADGEPAPDLRPGMSAVASLTVRDVEGAVLVPASAVVRSGDRDAVWRVTDGVIRRQLVRLGAQGDAQVQVLDGVSVGDRVVSRGADRVSDGQRLDEGG